LDAIETVAILGTGEAGGAWALLAALARCAVRLHDPGEDALEQTASDMRERVDLATGGGALTRSERQRVLDGVLFTPVLEEAVTAADLLVDAAVEPAGDPWPALGELLRASAAVAAAGLRTPAELAARLSHPGRVLALRLVRVPGPLPRAEASAGPRTTPHTLERVGRFVERINRAAGFPGRG
jgi:3-hydroxyacyl-CoA dehydrogenase